jgi:hypothetical protein
VLSVPSVVNLLCLFFVLWLPFLTLHGLHVMVNLFCCSALALRGLAVLVALLGYWIFRVGYWIFDSYLAIYGGRCAVAARLLCLIGHYR